MQPRTTLNEIIVVLTRFLFVVISQEICHSERLLDSPEKQTSPQPLRAPTGDSRPQRVRNAPKQLSPTPPINLDEVCGVKRGSKGAICEKPLNCKYHGLAQKRLVEGRSRPFEELFAAQQQAQRKAESARRDAILFKGNVVADNTSSEVLQSAELFMPPPPPDPKWQAEWIALLKKMPSYEEAAARTFAGHRIGWPEPIGKSDKEAPALRSLWGLPFSSLRDHPDSIFGARFDRAKRLRTDAMAMMNSPVMRAAEGE